MTQECPANEPAVVYPLQRWQTRLHLRKGRKKGMRITVSGERGAGKQMSREFVSPYWSSGILPAPCGRDARATKCGRKKGAGSDCAFLREQGRIRAKDWPGSLTYIDSGARTPLADVASGSEGDTLCRTSSMPPGVSAASPGMRSPCVFWPKRCCNRSIPSVFIASAATPIAAKRSCRKRSSAPSAPGAL